MNNVAKKKSARKKRYQENKHNSLMIDYTKLSTGNSYGTGHLFRNFYEDAVFICKDCGSKEVWTAEQQKWWYEEMHAYIDTHAVRCRACRIKEGQRKAEARRISKEGMARKRARQAQNKE
jgi:hypothetical protein